MTASPYKPTTTAKSFPLAPSGVKKKTKAYFIFFCHCKRCYTKQFVLNFYH